MLCKGIACSQVKPIEPSKYTDPDSGVPALLKALSSWEDSEEMVPFDKFERAIFETNQKIDESTLSFVNRLGVAFAELGDQDDSGRLIFQAFVLLRQSCLSVDDKKKILTMTGGMPERWLPQPKKRELSGSASNVTCPKYQQEVSTLTAKGGPGPLRFPLNQLANQLAATPAPFPFPLAQILLPPHP